MIVTTKLQTLHAITRPRVGEPLPPAGYRVRRCQPTDLKALARLYFAAYPAPVAGATMSEAMADMEATLAGSYGPIYEAASEAAVVPPDRIVAAILTVYPPIWSDAAAHPLIVELFTAYLHRRKGLARLLIGRCVDRAWRDGHERVILRADTSNEAALSLYRSEGFRERATESGSDGLRRETP